MKENRILMNRHICVQFKRRQQMRNEINLSIPVVSVVVMADVLVVVLVD